MITTSERAAQKLKETLIHKWFDIGFGFRVMKDTNDSGAITCSIKLDNKHAGDQVIESHGIKVFLDPISAAQLRDWELDYRDEPSQGFLLVRAGTNSEPPVFGKEEKSKHPGARSGLTKGGQK
jgi:Fe-S cluster assembly iron-binding protein IscA